MAKRIKVINPQNSPVFFNTKPLNNKCVRIPGKGFHLATEDEVAWVMSSSKVFERGFLALDKQAEMSDEIDKVETDNAMTDEEIDELMGKSAATIYSTLENIDNPMTLRRILEAANRHEKSAKMIGVIQEKLDSLTG